jgi:hypothetical protein
MLRRKILKFALSATTVAAALALTSVGATAAIGAPAGPHAATVVSRSAPHATHAAQAADQHVTYVGGRSGKVYIKASDGGAACWASSGACCPFYYVCGWSKTYGYGTFTETWICNDYDDIPNDFTGDGSWINNQSSGTVAYFLNKSHGVVYKTPPANPLTITADDDYNWHPIWYINACE